MAFYKMFQAMLNYPSNRPIEDLVCFTCNDVLFDEIEKVQAHLGLKREPLLTSKKGRGNNISC